MEINFDPHSDLVTEFGVILGDVVDPYIIWVPVDIEVQSVLRGMLHKTWQNMASFQEGPAKFEPSENYSGPTYLFVSLDDILAERFREFYRSDRFRIESKVIEKPDEIFCYFAHFTDEQDRRLIAIRRAQQFTIVHRQRQYFVFLSDALHIVKDPMFKLDKDFDLLVDSEAVYIWRPRAFEVLGDLKEKVLSAVPENIRAISTKLPYVDFENIEAYALKRPLAARYLASIRSHELARIDRHELEKYCEETNVEFDRFNGKMSVEEGRILDFLRVLDRRRYRVPFVLGEQEIYNASGRKISQ